MEQRRRFYFILTNIDCSTSASFWKIDFVTIPVINIKTQITTQYFVFRNCKKTILIRSAEVKDEFFCILYMLSIHTGLQKLSKTNVKDLHRKKRVHLILVYHTLRLKRVKCYLNNIEWILIGKIWHWGSKWWCNKA